MEHKKQKMKVRTSSALKIHMFRTPCIKKGRLDGSVWGQYSIAVSYMTNLNTIIATVGHQNDVVTVRGDARGLVEFTQSSSIAVFANLAQWVCIIVGLVTDTPAYRKTGRHQVREIYTKC